MPPSVTRSLMLALALFVPLVSLAAAADMPAGTVVLVKTTPDALVLWDSSPVLAKLVGDKVGPQQALTTLESDAMVIAAQRSAGLADAKSITVQVIYSKTGAVSPMYNTATFAGVEKLLTVAGSPADIAKNGTSYAAALARGDVPPGINISVTGKLPL
jgi:hypothetical protein